jgi:hypothetical protein
MMPLEVMECFALEGGLSRRVLEPGRHAFRQYSHENGYDYDEDDQIENREDPRPYYMFDTMEENATDLPLALTIESWAYRGGRRNTNARTYRT